MLKHKQSQISLHNVATVWVRKLKFLKEPADVVKRKSRSKRRERKYFRIFFAEYIFT